MRFMAPSGHIRSCMSYPLAPNLKFHPIANPESSLSFLLLPSNIMTNEQKKDWFLRLDPNGRIPILVDNTQSPPFTVMETSAELLYLLKFADKDDVFGFKDELERSQALQWLFFWHGSGAPYQGQVNHFAKFAKEKIPCAYFPFLLCHLMTFSSICYPFFPAIKNQ